MTRKRSATHEDFLRSQSPQSDHTPNSNPPLDGLLVADFSRILAGPLCTMLLADFGATVIKVEQPDRGDDTRHWGPPFTDEGAASYYLSINRNKRSVALNLKSPDDQRRALELACRADVVVENYRSGAMREFGLDYEHVSSKNPGVIYCSISGFGRGPGVDIPGYDFLVQAASGLMSITGESNGRPLKTGVAIVDVIAGLNATVGVLGALTARNRDGQGQQVEVDLMSSALFSLVNQASAFLTTGEIPHRMGNRHPSITPYETVETATETIAIAAANDRQFAVLCELLGLGRLPHNPDFATNSARIANRERLICLLEKSLAQRPADEWLKRLADGGIPCAPVNNISEAFEYAEDLGLEPTIEIRHVRSTANPIRFSSTPVSYSHPPPKLDEHGEELKSWLDSPEKAINND